MILRSNLSERLLILVLWCAGCGATGPALEFETTSTLDPDEPRRPTGVTLDPESDVPAPARRGQTEDLLVVLTPPPDLNAALAVVRRFFDAVLREDIAELEQLFEANASLELDTQTGKRRAEALWRSRLAQLDYQQLPAQELYRESEVEAYRKRDFDELEARSRPRVELGEDDLMLRVPLLVTKVDKVRLFGNEIVFVLRPAGRSFKIAEMVEPFQLQ